MEEAMCTERDTERERERVFNKTSTNSFAYQSKLRENKQMGNCISNINFASVFSTGCHTVDSNMIT
jgi:hypothetical protein